MEWFQALTTVALGCLFGGILAFSALFAPLVFTKLPMEHAGPFISVQLLVAAATLV